MIEQIQRVRELTRESFVTKFRDTRRPVIICGIGNGWPAYTKWSFDYLRSTIGSRQVPLAVSRNSSFQRGAFGAPEQRMAPFDQCLDKIERSVPTDPERLYLAQLPVRRLLPELSGDFSTPFFFEDGKTQKKVINVWIGSGGNVSPLHYDAADNLLVQVKGQKRLTLFDPSQSPLLYRHGAPRHNMSRVNITAPDLAAYPNFRRSRAVSCTLMPGEILFIPAFWWHHVETLDLAISLNFWTPALLRHHLNPTALSALPLAAKMHLGRMFN
jgi:hypothetical protein